MTTQFQSSKLTSNIATKYNAETFNVVFADHVAQKAVHMQLTVADTGYFEDRTAGFSYEGAYSVLDGMGQETPNTEMDGIVFVETSKGVFKLTKSKAEIV